MHTVKNIVSIMIILIISLVAPSAVIADSNVWNPNGNVGIGTTDPGSKLEIVSPESDDGMLRLINPNEGGESSLAFDSGKFDHSKKWALGVGCWGLSGKFSIGRNRPEFVINPSHPLWGTVIGIGTSSPMEKLDVEGGVRSHYINFPGGGCIGFNRHVPYGTILDSNHQAYQFSFNSANDVLQLESYRKDGSFIMCPIVVMPDGKVGIGGITPQSALAVKGTITAREVKVTASGWSDFVFDDNYKLLPLDQLKDYIANNKRLPDMPSGKELAEKDIAVSEMLAKQMQKIEELTMYLIEMKKENDALKGRLEKIEKAEGDSIREK